MNKLYGIRDTHTMKMLDELFFSAKLRAKEKRDELNGCKPADENAVLHYTVCYGPDHHRFQKD